MKRNLPWIVGGVLLWAVLDAAAQSPDPAGPPRWRLDKVSTLSYAPDEKPAKDAAERPRKFLYLRVQLPPNVAQPKLHKFCVTDAQGKTVAEAYGFYEENSLLVFAGDWRDLRGLYLDGLEQREPLFQEPDQPPKPEPGAGEEPQAKSPPSRTGKKPTVKSRDKGKGGVSGAGGGGSGGAGGGGGGSGGGRSGSGGGSGSGGPGGGGIAGRSGASGARGGNTIVPPVVPPPRMVLYLSCGEETGTGRVYEVDEAGVILGVVHLRSVATGLALHRMRGLVAVTPRDRSLLVRIDDRGKVDPILRKDPLLIHPVDVAVPVDSDTIVVADDIRHVLAGTDVLGTKPRVYHSFNLAPSERHSMSVAATLDKHLLYGSDNQPGVYRYSPVDYAATGPPLLPNPGGVAADTDSLKWAATQGPDEIVVFAGEELMKTLRLPSEAVLYGNGLLSFAPRSSVVVAARPKDDPLGEVWFYHYEPATGASRKLFSWTLERLADFVVGPPMEWPKYIRADVRPKY